MQWTSYPKIAMYTDSVPIMIDLPSPGGTYANLLTTSGSALE